MKTMEYFAKCKRGTCAEPDETWKRLVWHAAMLVSSAERERRTCRERAADAQRKRGNVSQMDLFEACHA